MTKKAKLLTWAESLGCQLPADPTVAQLEAAIEAAIATPADEPQYSFRDGLVNNWAVIRAEAVPTARAIVANLRGAT